MKEFKIYKKRHGQIFKLFGSIYSDNFKNAKKEFAKNCANDLYDECWLTYLNDKELKNQDYAGFYINESLVWNEDETINFENSEIDCFLTQIDIDKGFNSFSEDVYTWELRKK